jgi:YD repeat-containing protein
LTGTVNTAGSASRCRDGHERVQLRCRGLGVSTTRDRHLAYDGASQQDLHRRHPNTLETYNSAGRLLSTRDADGNLTSYTYTGSLITRIDTAAGESVFLDYTANNLSQIRTVTQAGSETKVRYSYDALNRLTQVIVDLTPSDNVAQTTDLNGDGRLGASRLCYVTTYTTTVPARVLITQGDGSTIASP